MPEIKHNFAGGKMNKDLDERLVPNGEYRDAVNIQVSTSEGSDVGTVQNILGNKLLEDNNSILSNLGAGVTCIGAIADEKNDAFYWFISAGTSGGIDYSAFTSASPQGISGVSKDVILQYKKRIRR